MKSDPTNMTGDEIENYEEKSKIAEKEKQRKLLADKLDLDPTD
jgi:predicted DNA-binding protein YlxM (UPF0122 family)